MGQVQVMDFLNKRKMDAWLKEVSNSVRIINVATTKRWGLMLGFFGDKKSYTVTYEKLADAPLASEVQAKAQAAEERRGRFWAWVVLIIVGLVLVMKVL
jgi:hypothetical protein